MELIWLECFTKKFVLIELFTPKITRAQEVEWQAACRLFSTKLQCSFCANFLQCERQHLIFIQQGLWSLPVVFFSSFKKKKKKSQDFKTCHINISWKGSLRCVEAAYEKAGC